MSSTLGQPSSTSAVNLIDILAPSFDENLVPSPRHQRDSPGPWYSFADGRSFPGRSVTAHNTVQDDGHEYHCSAESTPPDPSVNELVGLFYAMSIALCDRTPEQVASEACFLDVGHNWVKRKLAAGKCPSESQELWRGLWVEHAEESGNNEYQEQVNFPLRQTCILFFENLEAMLANEKTRDLTVELRDCKAQISYMLIYFQATGAPREEIARLGTAQSRIDDLLAQTPASSNTADAQELLKALHDWLGVVEQRVRTTTKVLPAPALQDDCQLISETSSPPPDSPIDSPLVSPVDVKLPDLPKIVDSPSEEYGSEDHIHTFARGICSKTQLIDASKFEAPQPVTATALLQPDPSLESIELPAPEQPSLERDGSSPCCDYDSAERGFEACREPEVSWPKFISFALDTRSATTADARARTKSSARPITLLGELSREPPSSPTHQHHKAAKNGKAPTRRNAASLTASSRANHNLRSTEASVAPSEPRNIPLERVSAIAECKLPAEHLMASSVKPNQSALSGFKLKKLLPRRVPVSRSRTDPGPDSEHTVAWALAKSACELPFKKRRYRALARDEWL